MQKFFRKLFDKWFKNIDAAAILLGQIFGDFEGRAFKQVINICFEAEPKKQHSTPRMLPDELMQFSEHISGLAVIHFARGSD